MSAVVAAVAIAAVAPTADAQSAVSGVGDSSGSTSLLTVDVGGDALGLRVLGEDSETSNDPANGGPSALERVTPLSLASTLVPALGAASAPAVETSSTGGEDVQSTPAIDLGSLVAGSPVPGLLSGTIDPFALRSAVDAAGATSAADGATRDLAVLGGLLRTGTASADLGSTALTSDSDAVRGLQLDSLEVLDLQALLDALGISLADLPIDAAVGLLDALGLPLPGGVSADALLATIDGLLTGTASARSAGAPIQAQIDALQEQLATATSQLPAAQAEVTAITADLAAAQAELSGLACAVVPALCAQLQGEIAALTTDLADANAAVATLNSTINTLQAQIDALLAQLDALLAPVLALVGQLTDILDGLLDGLGDASLLSVSDLVVGVTARATDSVDTSVASVVGSVGDVSIGALSLGGLDAGAALGQVTALTDQLVGTLGGVLGTIDPSLADLIDVSLLEQTSSVTESDDAISAIAGITGLAATVTPPDVCALLDTLGAADTLGSVLQEVGTLVPSLPGPVGDVLGDLGSTVTCTAGAAAGDVSSAALVDGVASALTQPLTVEALSVSGASTFVTAPTPAPGTPATPAAPTDPSSLPETGGTGWLALAALLGAAGYGVRRLLVRTT